MAWTDRTDRWLRAYPVIPDSALAVALGAVIGPSSLGLLRSADAERWALWVAGGCGVLLLGSIALRQVATEAAFVLASLAMAVTVALPNAEVRPADVGLSAATEPIEIPLFYLPTSAVHLILLYTVAARLAGPKNLLALVVGVGGALACTAKSATAYGALPTGWLTLLLVLLALLAAVAGTWALGRFRFEQRRRLAEEAAAAAEEAVAEERRRIARDMHDIVAHSLAVIVRQAEGGSSIAARSPDRAKTALATIADTAREALTDMRGTLRVLHEGASPDDARPTLAEVPALVDRVRATGLDVRLSEQGSATGMTPGARMAAYRLIQEALTNSVKHAGQQPRVTVIIAHGRHASVVTVADDGGTAGHRPAVPGAGVGLQGVQARVQAAGGRFEAGLAEEGYRVRAEFPHREQGGPE